MVTHRLGTLARTGHPTERGAGPRRARPGSSCLRPATVVYVTSHRPHAAVGAIPPICVTLALIEETTPLCLQYNIPSCGTI